MLKILSSIFKRTDVEIVPLNDIPLQPNTVQECPETLRKIKSTRAHISKQMDSHAHNNAHVKHKRECDMFSNCQGCDEWEPDKIVGEPYEIK